MALEKSHIHISSKSTNSKKDGTFIIRNIPNGSAKVLITYVGYKPIDTIIDINGNLHDPAVKNALQGVRTEVADFKILGNY